MYIMGDRYIIEGLKKVSRANFECKLDNLCTIERDWTPEESNELVEALKSTYDGTPEGDRGLRDIAQKYIFCYKGRFLVPQKGQISVHEAMEEVSGYRKDLLDGFVREAIEEYM